MDIILATRNPSKAKQIGAVFAGLPITIKSLDDFGIEGEAVEDGSTLEENAMKKASYAWEKSAHQWSMADDTGVFISALNGAPGIHAARWAGNVSTEEIMHHTLRLLKDKRDRTGVFRTVAVVISRHGSPRTFVGEMHGTFLKEPRTQCQPMMPYSAIFVPDGQEKTWAEMSVAGENAISHRGKAFALVRSYLAPMLS